MPFDVRIHRENNDLFDGGTEHLLPLKNIKSSRQDTSNLYCGQSEFEVRVELLFQQGIF